MDSTAVINLVVTLAVLAWLLTRQLTERPLKEKSRIGLVLIVVGAIETVSFAGSHSLSAHDALLLVASLVVGIVLAALRAFTVRLRTDGGQITRRGTWLTAVLWIVGIGLHYLMDAGVSSGFGSVTVLLYFGVVLLAQRQILLARARGAGVLAR
jgi:FtsH-binding integral membrane protein